MIKPPSIQKDYTLIFSGDPALDLPDLAPDAADAETKKNATIERERVLRVARETGKWPIKPAETATLFQCEPLFGLVRQFADGEFSRERMSENECRTLVFRLAVRTIDNLEDIKITYTKLGGFRALSDETMDAILSIGAAEGVPEVGRAIVNEIGGAIYQHARSPLSKN